MKSDFNEKFNIHKKIIYEYLKLYNVSVEYNGVFGIDINRLEHPSIKILFLYNEYIHEETYIYKIIFDDLLKGQYKQIMCKNINEVLEELKSLMHNYFKDFKKKCLQISLFDI